MDEIGDAGAGEYNEELVEQIFPLVKWSLICLNLARLLLVFISLKNLAICRNFLYI